ncbi:MAG: deaminase [Candidatus Uhrbacteria bacterium]
MKTAVVAYVPVLHDGYRQFFQKYSDKADLYILGPELIAKFPHLKKEIRQLEPTLVKTSVTAWNIFENIFVLDENGLKELLTKEISLVLPKEDIMLELRDQYFPEHEVIFDNIFLRWDKHNTVEKNPLNPEALISNSDFDKKMIALTYEEAEKSSDWWRRIGCVVIKDEKIILKTHNEHLPTDHTPYINGDPRNNFHKGDHLELGTSIHGEAEAIATAAKQGISLEGTEVYVTTFPCPPCAKLIAKSGIKKIYYRVGYGILDGESVLKDHGVEIIQVAE